MLRYKLALRPLTHFVQYLIHLMFEKLSSFTVASLMTRL